jgi:hypothetical protein
MPSHDPAVQLQNLRLQHPQLNAESRDTGARDLGQPFVAGVSVLCAPKGAASVLQALTECAQTVGLRVTRSGT